MVSPVIVPSKTPTSHASSAHTQSGQASSKTARNQKQPLSRPLTQHSDVRMMRRTEAGAFRAAPSAPPAAQPLPAAAAASAIQPPQMPPPQLHPPSTFDRAKATASIAEVEHGPPARRRRRWFQRRLLRSPAAQPPAAAAAASTIQPPQMPPLQLHPPSMFDRRAKATASIAEVEHGPPAAATAGSSAAPSAPPAVQPPAAAAAARSDRGLAGAGEPRSNTKPGEWEEGDWVCGSCRWVNFKPPS